MFDLFPNGSVPVFLTLCLWEIGRQRLTEASSKSASRQSAHIAAFRDTFSVDVNVCFRLLIE